MSEDPERDDPVLVRPYIKTQPGGSAAGHDDRAAQTWPATADLPEDGTREQAAVTEPVVTPDPAAKSTALRRQRLMVLAGVAALALLGGAALFLLLPSDEDNPPATAAPAPAAPSVTGTLGAAPAASGATRNASPSSRAGSRSAAASRTATGPAPGGPGQPATTAPPTAAPSATLALPPDPPRTGPITAAGGRCLNLTTLLGLDGSPVQTAACSDISYQRWTMASDGTLRVANRCARVSDDAAVRIGGCDDQPAGQWRAGPNGSLVNTGTGRCLTDPGAAMTTVTVTDCTGTAGQRWTLP